MKPHWPQRLTLVQQCHSAAGYACGSAGALLLPGTQLAAFLLSLCPLASTELQGDVERGSL